MQQLKFGFRIATNWTKYESKISIDTRNPYLDSFQEENRLFVLLCENNDDRESHRDGQMDRIFLISQENWHENIW